MYDFEKYKALLKTKLKETRYIHSLGVMQTAYDLAITYGEDAEKAKLAGLLHDITKYFTKEEHLKILSENGIEITEEILNSPNIWHSYTSAFYVRNELGISDEEIFKGIYYHTTGKSDMTLFEKIIYVADLVEPNRDYPEAKNLYDLSFKDLDKVVYEGVKWCIISNCKKDNFIYADTFDLYNDCVLRKRRTENDI